MGKYRETYIKNTKEAITYHINKGAEFARPVKAIEQKRALYGGFFSCFWTTRIGRSVWFDSVHLFDVTKGERDLSQTTWTVFQKTRRWRRNNTQHTKD
jgi:hypothetical protein